MAVAALQPAMNVDGTRQLHPFFSKPNDPSIERKIAVTNSPAEDLADDPDYDANDAGSTRGKKKRAGNGEGLKSKKEGIGAKRGRASLDAFTQRTNTHSSMERDHSLDNHEMQASTDTSSNGITDAPCTKRRKTVTASPPLADLPRPPAEGMDWHEQLQVEAKKGLQEESALAFQTAPHISDPNNMHHTSPATPEPQPGRENTEQAASVVSTRGDTAMTDVTIASDTNGSGKRKRATSKRDTSKKTLKLNKNGKLLSSPPVNTEADVSASPRRKRGRPPKAKPALPITIIKYGSDADSKATIGKKIDNILKSQKTAKGRPGTPRKAAPKSTGPLRATHPFFLGKATEKQDESPAKSKTQPQILQLPKTPKRSAVTPGKLRAETQRHCSPRAAPSFGSIGSDPRITKHPGMSDAPWPSQDSAHVRNMTMNEFQGLEMMMNLDQDVVPKSRKQKSNVLKVPHETNLMIKLSHQLSADLQPTHDNAYLSRQRGRLPDRLLISGVYLQERIQKELRTRLPLTGKTRDDSLGALDRLFKDIEHTLTPFDRGECETQSWTQKYAPRSTSDVLQVGSEAKVLRNWLTSLTVMAVENRTDTSKASEARKPLKKKRKKTEDQFIVDDDDDEEEEEDMVALPTGDDLEHLTPNISKLPSQVRPKFARNNNVVILSGPHGCGKSATVFAVAKELGFDVFEINSASRRSGKDVQDRVGDMSENHLVNNKSKVAADTEDTDNERMSTALQKDLDSGRQGTMASFFKTAPKTQAKPRPEKSPEKVPKNSPKKPSAIQTSLGKPQASRKQQKQSLILFEEADILFEEDQQFWSQVVRLASASKRPIVITCNDEKRIPSWDLPLGALLRFAPVPVDLAVDYLLLIGAREGHLLRRNVVSDLFKSKNHDLRASITELDFWCQMSVGDKKGGLEWIYQRWPPGEDVDEHGRVLRVASENTLQSGMGWFSHDALSSSSHVGFDQKAELLTEVWQDWGLSPDTLANPRKSASLPQADFDNASRNLRNLERIDGMLESISATDIYCRVGLPTYDKQTQEYLDPSMPSISAKDRLSYINAVPVIQIDPVFDFSNFDTNMYVQSHLSIKRAYSRSLSPFSMSPEPPGPGVHTKHDIQDDFVHAILHHKHQQRSQHSLSRLEFSHAFDILAGEPDATSYPLQVSSFDRTFRLVAEDLAPYVRSIVAHEIRLESERLHVSNFLSQGGTARTARNTRASRTAMEGGTRQTKRKEHWFDKDLNRVLVMETAGEQWAGLGSVGEEGSKAGDTASVTGSPSSSAENQGKLTLRPESVPADVWHQA